MRQQMLADQTLNGARLSQILADHDRKRQKIRYAPWLAPTQAEELECIVNRHLQAVNATTTLVLLKMLIAEIEITARHELIATVNETLKHEQERIEKLENP